MGGSRLTDEQLAKILEFPALEELDISRCYNLTNEAYIAAKPSHISIICDSLQPWEVEWDEDSD
jgi:hypothetical protein